MGVYEYYSGNCVLFLEVFIILKHMLCYITLSEIQDSSKLGGLFGWFFSPSLLLQLVTLWINVKDICSETLLVWLCKTDLSNATGSQFH